MAPAGASGLGASALAARSGPRQTVLVTSTVRPDPYDASSVGDPAANAIDSLQRTARTQAVHNVVAAATGLSGQDLPAANGVVADVTADQLAALQATPGVVVTPDVAVSVADASFGGGLVSALTSTVTSVAGAATSTLGNTVSTLSSGPTSAASTPTSASGATRAPAAVFPQTTGATALAARGIDGSGVTVAVLDTGIDKLKDFGSRIVGGVDLSGEGNPYQDSYGHGTFVAGLVAGNGKSSKGQYAGEAPGANLVAVKVAGVTGVTDVATVIQGINWVVQNANQYNIRVLNMSLGAIPTTSSVLNPLDQAVETAWQAGIVVVISAGNSGPFNGTILSPGDDPLAITVGALDDTGSTDPTQALGTSFSSVGPTNIDGWFKPDFVTSGRSVVSLRAPGSTIDLANPTAEIGTSNFVGSGTSFSAAIASGAAALEIQSSKSWPGRGKFPITPDQVKAELLGTTTPGPVGNPFVDGHGALNVYNAVTQPGLQLAQTVPTVATNIGDTVNLYNTWLGSSWNGSSWNGSSWTGSSWNGSSWNGSSWNGSSWNGSSWNGSSWNGSSWNGSSWNGSSWNGSSWNGSSWNGSSWNGSSWNGSSWNGSSWNGSSWN